MMSSPTAFYSPFATITKDEEKVLKAKMAVIIERYKGKVSTLPKNVANLCRYEGCWYKQGFWYQSKADFSVEAIMAAQDDFQALPTDILYRAFWSFYYNTLLIKIIKLINLFDKKH
uniref:Uncharacterized protein n=2 Tax=Helianthus annuus TaxID=4232 RepID=A0A251TE36_HELAN